MGEEMTSQKEGERALMKKQMAFRKDKWAPKRTRGRYDSFVSMPV